MSSDNYYVVMKHPNGGFAAVMGFVSDDTYPTPTEKHQSFDTLEKAILWATNEYSEYGVSVHPECLATNNEPYMPTTEEVRDAFICGEHPDSEKWADEFDRWLAAHDAEVYQRGREYASRAVHKLHDDEDNLTHSAAYVMGWCNAIGSAVIAAREGTT